MNGYQSKQALGAFYTPNNVAEILVRWAIGRRLGTILDPSFGGCSFLEAAADHFQTLGLEETHNHVFGVDIDPRAQCYLRQLNRVGQRRATGRIANFFSTTVDSLPGAPYGAVVGNPPYLRHHLFRGEARRTARSAISRMGLHLSETTNAWVYFVLHATSMLKRGGRLALVLPGAALHADYAKPLFPFLEQNFTGLRLTYVRSRLFEKTDQDSVVLFAAGFGQGIGTVEYSEVADASALATAVHSKTRDHSSLPLDGWKQALLAPKVGDQIVKIRSTKKCYRLAELAKMRIGVVTGANSFFLRSVAHSNELASSAVKALPIICRSAWLNRPQWDDNAQQEVDDGNEKSRLLCISPDLPLNEAIKKEIRLAEKLGISRRYKCKKRSPWYSLEEADVPDAFLRYMSGSGFWLVANRTSATCTNAIHRLWWLRSRLPVSSIIVGSWTSFFQLEAEMAARCYGGGVLKVEPSEAIQMHVPVHTAAGTAIRRISRIASEGNLQGARDAADMAVLRSGLGLSAKMLSSIRDSLGQFAERRGG